jgi:transketolase
VVLAWTFGWDGFVGWGGATIGMTTFGASAPLAQLQKKFGFTIDHVVATAHQVLNERKRGSA